MTSLLRHHAATVVYRSSKTAVDLLEISDVGERTWVLPEPSGPPPMVSPLSARRR